MKNFFVLQASAETPDPGASLQALLDTADLPALELHSTVVANGLFVVTMRRVSGLGFSMSDEELEAALVGYIMPPR